MSSAGITTYMRHRQDHELSVDVVVVSWPWCMVGPHTSIVMASGRVWLVL